MRDIEIPMAVYRALVAKTALDQAYADGLRGDDLSWAQSEWHGALEKLSVSQYETYCNMEESF